MLKRLSSWPKGGAGTDPGGPCPPPPQKIDPPNSQARIQGANKRGLPPPRGPRGPPLQNPGSAYGSGPPLESFCTREKYTFFPELTIIIFPKLAEAAGNARGVPNGGVRSRSAISGKMCISSSSTSGYGVVGQGLFTS